MNAILVYFPNEEVESCVCDWISCLTSFIPFWQINLIKCGKRSGVDKFLNQIDIGHINCSNFSETIQHCWKRENESGDLRWYTNYGIGITWGNPPEASLSLPVLCLSFLPSPHHLLWTFRQSHPLLLAPLWETDDAVTWMQLQESIHM